MSADPIGRLRAARPPTPAWADTTDGRDTWERTERRGLEAEFPDAFPHGRQVRSSRWLVLTAGALVLVGGTAVATVGVTGRSVGPSAVAGASGQTATGRVPAADAGGAIEHARMLDPLDGSLLLQPSWLPAGFVLVHQGADPSGSAWSRTWARPGGSTSTPRASGCRPGSPPITVDEGVGVRVPAQSGDERLAAQPVVDGVRATVVRTGDHGLTLTWTPLALPSGAAVSISTAGACSGNPVSSLATLIRAARGLE